MSGIVNGQETPVQVVDREEIGRRTGVPAPGSRVRGVGWGVALGVGWGGQAAAVEEGDEVAAVALGGDAFGEGDGDGVEVDGGAEFVAGDLMDAVVGGLFVADDAAGDVPTGAVVLVAAPGEEGAAAVVLEEEVDVDEGGDAADEEEEFFGEAGGGVDG